MVYKNTNKYDTQKLSDAFTLMTRKDQRSLWSTTFTREVIKTKKIVNALDCYAWNCISLLFNVLKIYFS